MSGRAKRANIVLSMLHAIPLTLEPSLKARHPEDPQTKHNVLRCALFMMLANGMQAIRSTAIYCILPITYLNAGLTNYVVVISSSGITKVDPENLLTSNRFRNKE